MSEFNDFTDKELFSSRLQDKTPIIITATYQDQLAGYKIGYKKSKDEFYSWLGGVVPEYRKMGIATKLRLFQEEWVLKAGYTKISVKSMNCYPAMLQLLIRGGYKINGYQDNGDADSSKIKFIKYLTNTNHTN